MTERLIHSGATSAAFLLLRLAGAMHSRRFPAEQLTGVRVNGTTIRINYIGDNICRQKNGALSSPWASLNHPPPQK